MGTSRFVLDPRIMDAEPDGAKHPDDTICDRDTEPSPEASQDIDTGQTLANLSRNVLSRPDLTTCFPMADPQRQDMERNAGSHGNTRTETARAGRDLDTLRIAVRNGADAVYFGARAFNARARAANFDDRQLLEAVDYLHLHRARAYLALNTLIADREADEALRLAETAYRIGVDALIVQDIGLTCAIHERMPDFRLFASTQMSVGNERGIQAARDLGLSRVILPRERTALEVRRLTAFAADIGMETEVFVHGALCVSFSGQCLMSALQGGRSANRGACAQPCRMMYALESNGGETGGVMPRLSLRDQSLYDQIPQ
jgi:putative protease